jgi:hypothetical protein
MATIYNQPPHFDISTLDFAPIGEVFPVNQIAIPYDYQLGNTRQNNRALRRHTFIYNNNQFNYHKTFSGILSLPENIVKVNDTSFLNEMINNHSSEILNETNPEEYITQELMHFLFNNPNQGGTFFIEGSISIHFDNMREGFSLVSRPKYFKLYRYGKIINNAITVFKESQTQMTNRRAN